MEFVARLQIDDPNKPNGPCMSLAIQNAASYIEGPVAPSEMITIRGAAFAPDAPACAPTDPNGRIATELAGVQIFFDQTPAPLLYVQAQQINAIAPWEIAGRPSTRVHVEYGGVATNVVSIPIADSTPAIFHVDYTSPQGAILNADGSPNSSRNPARPGTVVAIYGTGGGLTSPIGITGGFWPMSPLARITLPVSVKIGDMEAEVLYAGAAPTLPTGFFQINARIPEGLQPSVYGYPVVLRVEGASSPSTTTTVAVR